MSSVLRARPPGCVVGLRRVPPRAQRADSAAIDRFSTFKVDKWSSDNGHGYVGVTGQREMGAACRVAERESERTSTTPSGRTMGNPAAYCHAWWVFVHRTADGSTVNFDSPVSMVLCGPEPAIGISPSGFGDLSLYLAVGVEPVTAPARSRTNRDRRADRRLAGLDR